MVITSSILFYQLAKKIDFVEKKAPSDKLQIKNIRFYNGKTEVGYLYLVDCRKLNAPISAKKPVSLIFINAEDLNRNFIPKNCDYAIFKNVRNFFDLAEVVYETINDLQEWDGKLKDGISARYPLDEYGALAKDVIHEPLSILNHNFSLLDLEGEKNKDVDESIYRSNFGQSIDIKKAKKLLGDKQYQATLGTMDTYIFYDTDKVPSLCMNIISDNRYIARVMCPAIYYNGEIDEGQVQLFRHFFRYIKQVYLRYSEDPLIKRSSDKLHMLIYDLIYNPESIDATDANLILQNYGWNQSNRYAVIKFSFYKNTKWDELTEYICGKLEETWANSCAIIHDDDIIWVFNYSISKSADDEHKFFHVLAYIVRDFVCKAGVSDIFRGLDRLPSYLLQAARALEVGQKCNPDKWYFKFSDYALDYMYDRIVSELSYDQVISESIRKLISYDKKNNTEYVTTLKCYLSNNCNSTHTAEELYVHRTTLIRRIDRIQEIGNIDFEDKENKIYMILSFWLLEKMGFEF